jgi:hypothetical protein
MMGRLSRKCNSDRVIQKTVRRERRERKRVLESGQVVWGMEVGTGHVPLGNLGTSWP